MPAGNSTLSPPNQPQPLMLKVCGMREPDNIAEIVQLQPQWLGFIFYAQSARYVGSELDTNYLKSLPAGIKKVGVFVNEAVETMREVVEKYNLQAVQLHGEESPAVCQKLKNTGITVLKAFPVDDAFDFNSLVPYDGTCNYFLFDTKGPQYGGNGATFNWEILKNYAGKTPFFLSGGISPEHAAEIKKLDLPLLAGLDINSRFELRPALKDVPKVTAFIEQIRN
jgi:phosphoribosylanthranilate isomerase